jgi:tetratricopeptide (TPR) repeat protein
VTQSGTPIDTSEYDQEITKAEKASKAKPKDEQAKKALAEGYLKRAIALTEARQYASALGDYRRVLKLDENNEEAKKWIRKSSRSTAA